jgi:hypothetical protein
MSISNTDLAILEEIQRTAGGTISAVGQRRPAWKPEYALIWTNAAAARVIRRVSPFLRVKSQQSETLLAFDAHIRAGRRFRDRAGHLLPMSAKEVKFREGLYRRVKRLNRRGAVGPREVTRKTTPRKQSRISPAYVAGFIDAEGSLMITKTKVARYEAPEYRPRISIANTDKGVLEIIQHAYGGIMAYQPAPKAAWKNAHQLVWTEGMIESLLLEVRAHLRVKRRQARILTDFIRYTNRTKRARSGRVFAVLPSKVLTFRESLQREIKDLNRKGPTGMLEESKYRRNSPGKKVVVG